MNAEDERFISQGVYNMLYGTVELLMVSAEAAKVTEDSGNNSANRSEVGKVCLTLGKARLSLRFVICNIGTTFKVSYQGYQDIFVYLLFLISNYIMEVATIFATSVKYKKIRILNNI